MTTQNTPADDGTRAQGGQPTDPIRPVEADATQQIQSAQSAQSVQPAQQVQPGAEAPHQSTLPLPPVPAAPVAQQAQPTQQVQHGAYRAQQPAYQAPAGSQQGQPGQQPQSQPTQQPYGQHASTQHAAPQGAAAQHTGAQDQHRQQPYGAAFGQQPAQATAVATAPAKRRLVLPIATTAVLAAVLASVGTAALTGQLGSDDAAGTTPTSISSVGQKGDSSVAVPVAESTDGSPDWKAVSAAVAPSVVAIKVTTAEGQGEGSGVIIDDQGHILTNDHVVSGATDDTVQVTLADGRVYDAKITGLDPATDLAVVQLVDPPSDLQSAVFADSGDVTVGDAVMAVGNPLGLSNTATTGIVSAIDRPVSTATSTSSQTAVVTNAIQIDAAINPGNSGGPLFNSKGEVIGITSSIASLSSSSSSSQSGSIGLGFAIPSSLAQNIGSQLIDSGKAEHAFLGVTLTDGTGTADGTTRQGAVVSSVSDSSPASAAGLQADDVVVAIDGKAVTGAESLTGFVRGMASGTEVTLTVVRDGKAIDVKVTLATKTEEATSNDEGSSGSSGSNGSDGSSDGQSTQPGQGTLPGSDSPNNIPDFSDLFPGQNG